MAEPDNLVLKLLREMRDDMATKKDIAALRSELKSDIKDLASDLRGVDKRLTERINHLNRAVIEYHSSAVGHGILISEFEDRLRRVEEHLKLPPVGTN